MSSLPSQRIMDLTNCSKYNGTVGEFIHHLEDVSNTAAIPAVVMLALFAAVGLVGNILVLVVYSQKVQLNPTKVLIMTIATFDLVANVAAIPTAILTILDTWDFQRPTLCKITAFLGAFTSTGGAISLIVVAVIRYRKVCRPYGWHLTVKQSIYASIGTVILSVLISSPYLVLYGVRTRNTPCPSIYGTDCFADDEFVSTQWPFLNNIVFVLAFLTLSVSMIVMYSLIWFTAWKHSKFNGVLTGDAFKTENRNNKKSIVKVAVISASDNEAANQKSTRNNSIRNDTSQLCCIRRSSFEISTDDIPSKNTTKSTSTTWTELDEIQLEPTNSQLCVDSKFEIQLESTNPQSDVDSKSENTGFNFISPLFNMETVHDKKSLLPEHQHELRHQSNCSSSENNTDYKSLDLEEESKFSGTLLDNKEFNLVLGEAKISGSLVNNGQNGHVAPSNFNEEIYISKEDFNSKLAPKHQQDPSSFSPNSANKNKRRRPLGRMTAMLVIISAIFVCGYFPFLVLTIYKKYNTDKYDNFSMGQQVVYHIFYRLYFLNSVANPIVYSFCDLNFRRKCIQLLTCKTTHNV